MLFRSRFLTGTLARKAAKRELSNSCWTDGSAHELANTPHRSGLLPKAAAFARTASVSAGALSGRGATTGAFAMEGFKVQGHTSEL